MAKSKRTALYRHYDDCGKLLYVGISLSAIQRFSQHMANSCWSKSSTRMDIEWFETKEEALSAERKAIVSEKPIHNTLPAKRKKVSGSSGEKEQIRILIPESFKTKLMKIVKKHRIHRTMTGYIMAAIWEKIDREANQK